MEVKELTLVRKFLMQEQNHHHPDRPVAHRFADIVDRGFNEMTLTKDL